MLRIHSARSSGIPSCSHTGQVFISFSKMLIHGWDRGRVGSTTDGGDGGDGGAGGALRKGGDEGLETFLGRILGIAANETLGTGDGSCAGRGGRIGPCTF